MDICIPLSVDPVGDAIFSARIECLENITPIEQISFIPMTIFLTH